jgi:plasmid rolling circle replication initiator protein Rep
LETCSAAIVAANARGVKTCVPGPHLVCSDDVPEPENLADYAPSEKPWDIHRAQADVVEEHYSNVSSADAEIFQRLAERMSLCALVVEFRWTEDAVTRDTGELHFRLRSAWFCRVRTCPTCQWRRSLRHKARFYKALEKLWEKEDPASVTFIFLTITVKNPEITDLRSQLMSMGTAWSRFIRLKEFANIQGWIRTTEVTYGEDSTPDRETAHPHFHVLMMVRNSWFKKSYVSHESWRNAWKKAARLDYDPQVFVEKVYKKDEHGNKIKIKGVPTKEQVGQAAVEALKYVVKPQDAQAHRGWFLEFTRQIKKLHFIASGGVFAGIFREKEEETQMDLFNPDEEDNTEQIQHGPNVAFGWNKPVQHYRRIERITRQENASQTLQTVRREGKERRDKAHAERDVLFQSD